MPSMFVSGKSDWGVYQRAGRLEAMRDELCTDFRGVHLLDGAGHWVHHDRLEEFLGLVLPFLG